MAWQVLIVEVAAAQAEPLADALLESGAQSVSIEDADAGSARETPRFGEPGESAAPWPCNRIAAVFDAQVEPAAALGEAARAAGFDAERDALPAYRIEPLDERDWVRATQAQSAPLWIAGRLWVVPSWCEPPQPDAINLRIDPGLAFGTGSHPSTRLVLAWLADRLGWAAARSARVLDYGCGSGILAIAAMKLGAAEAYGVDIDPQAIAASAENAARNAVELRLYLPDALPEFRADIIVANILARPLIALAPALARRAAGRIALSGILAAQAEEVLAPYRDWFDIAVAAEQEGWVLLSGVRR